MEIKSDANPYDFVDVGTNQALLRLVRRRLTGEIISDVNSYGFVAVGTKSSSIEMLEQNQALLRLVRCGLTGEYELNIKHKRHLADYNHTLATTLVEYASAGFVGVAKDLNAIVIAFRGTQEHSIPNWIEDLHWKQLDLNYPGMPDAMVHHGFYFAYHNTTVRPGVVNAVKRAKELYGNLDIMVTGHSMGGAMAAFCGLDLTVNHETGNVQVVTFGQPRIGNAAFVSYYGELVPNTIRVTNGHDIVPHLPPYYPHFAQKTYHHFPREVIFCIPD
ncbi:alpha/beta-Hydrolases superfamily protein [Actinidia rufa]|uniref:Alpha/beta-Hydrolases superfamily protein n=1 Tax=Actinidia rufa TaxID=165716 RepID=A0A7J0GT88_9ERIC|nr:alpha/beta-Hydrolases superfamily protein [Actinidia rufa]